MISLKQLFQSQMSKYFSILFASFMLVFNIGLFVVAYIEYQQVTIRQEQSMTELISHLMMDEDNETVIVYLEHYYHTHGVKIRLYDASGTILFDNIPQTSEETLVALYTPTNTYLGSLMIDFDSFVIGSEFTYGIVLFNVLSLFVFVMILISFIRYLNKQYELIDSDLKQLGSSNNQFHFTDLETVNDSLKQSSAIEEQLKRLQKNAIHILAHDVKTPLTIMKAYLEAIKSKRIAFDDQVNSDMLEEIQTIDRLIPKLISLDIDEVPTTINLKGVISQVIDSMKEVLATKQMVIKSNLDDFDIFASKEDAKRVIEHLLYNALYYSDATKLIEVSLSQTNKTLEIIDQGIGMTEETINQLFKGPFRNKLASSYHKKGSGIGLQIVLLIVKKWNASISIKSKPKEGTHITIFFSS
jgi:two-component system, OmpR family, phosphate regulon sensor histidine kinase PhoR